MSLSHHPAFRSHDPSRPSALQSVPGRPTPTPAAWHPPHTRLLIDVLVVTTAVALVAVVREHPVDPWTIAYASLAVATMAARGAYVRRLEDSLLLVLVRHVVFSAVVALMATTTLRVLVDVSPGSGRSMVAICVVSTVALAVARIGGAYYDRHAHRQGTRTVRAVIVGCDEVALRVERRLRARPDIGLLPIGYLDDDRDPPTAPVEGRGLPVLGTLSALRQVLASHQIDAIVLTPAESATSHSRLVDLVKRAHAARLTVFSIPLLHPVLNARTEHHRLGTLPVQELRPVDPRSRLYRAKYVLDRIIAAVAIVVLSPLLVAIAIAVKLSDPGPVLFRQRRVGLDGHEFDILKFRSMRQADASAPAWHPPAGSAPGGVEGVDRRTAVGRFLRRTNLDELPQLLNIARGDMSIVGPRPERPEFVARYSQALTAYDARHRVKSGLTGWAQVHGFRGQTSIAERAEWDNYYIENWTFALDVVIVLRTLKTFFEADD